MTNSKIAVVDIETTALKSEIGTIVEVGICELNLQDGNIEKLIDTVVCETDFNRSRAAHAWVFQNSSLTVEDVLNAPSWELIKPQITQIFNDYPVTAYNLQFDLTWLRDRGVKLGKVLLDPMIESTNILQLPSKNPNYSSFKWPTVEECWQWYFPDVEYVELHRAYDDCFHEAQIFHKMYTVGHI